MSINKILYPELLSTSELIEILTSLCVHVSPNDSRSHLLEMFKKVALPLPQRSNWKLHDHSYHQFVEINQEENERDSVLSCEESIKKLKLQNNYENENNKDGHYLTFYNQNGIVETNTISKQFNKKVILKRSILNKYEDENIKRIKK